ncbi:MAG: hypothetical protein GEV03_20905 [Streptosporangiales bacterium]|nr:hypothetical protein [Streptosporangiales bacterium]
MTAREERPLSTADAVRTLLNPRSVALVGASADESKFSGQPLRNLLDAGYPGAVHVVNRRGGTILGVPARTAIDELPPGVDVGLVMVPAAQTVHAVEELGRAGVPVAVVAVSGFAEVGTAEGAALQRQLAAAGRDCRVRIVGPNCNGVYNTTGPLPLGYNYTHSQRLAPGRVGLVSHSGAMLGGFVPLLERYGQSISSFVSCGNEVDLDLLDFVEYLVDDPHTNVIGLILDGVSDGPAFRRLVRGAAERGKPVAALKLGNSQRGVTATQAHSSRLAGSRAAYEAVFDADGVVSAPTLETLAACCGVLAEGRRPRSRGVVATSTSGAGGILLADTLSAAGRTPPRLAPTTVDRMRSTAGFAQVLNPFDIGAAGVDSVAANLHALAADPGAGTLILYLTPVPTMSWRQALAEAVARIAEEAPTLPVLVVSPGPLAEVEERTYHEARIPVLPSLLDAVAVVESLASGVPAYQQEPHTTGPASTPRHGTLSEPESKRLLARYGIAFPREILTGDLDEGFAAARKLGYPVVVKAAGSAIAHKSEHGLVALDVPDAESLRRHYTDVESRARRLDPAGFEGVLVGELVGDGVDVMLGVTVDPDFGPMVLVGTGGVLTELVADVATAPVPLDGCDARRLLARTKVDRLLAGYRGAPPYDREALVEQMLRLSAAAQCLRDDVAAVDLNPVRVAPGSGGAVALDALVVRGTR